MREILLAKSAGFCYGVRRAVRMAEEAATDCSSCVMLGSIIHNAHVVEDLGRKGVRRISRPDEVCEGETVIIRSHGEAKAVLEALEARGGCSQFHLPAGFENPAVSAPCRRRRARTADHRRSGPSRSAGCGRLVQPGADLSIAGNHQKLAGGGYRPCASAADGGFSDNLHTKAL